MWFSDLFLAAEISFVELKTQNINQIEWSHLGEGLEPFSSPLSSWSLWAQFENYCSADLSHFKACPAICFSWVNCLLS